MTTRRVSRIVTAVETAEGEGAVVKRVFPTRHLASFDPFPLLDEFGIESPAGFPDHPHAGFEAVTYMLEGGFHHRDNIGNDSVVMAGGVQRFTAGKPIVHSELPGAKGLNRGLQLWVRLPNRLRNLDPSYQQVDPKEVPVISADGNFVRTVVGNGSPVKLHTETSYVDVALKTQRPFTHEVGRNLNAFVYVLEGAVNVGNERVNRNEAGLLTEGDSVELSATGQARAVVIGGKPQGEQIVIRGSFVY